MGHQFENLVVNNVRRLVPHLHLDWSRVKSAAPFLVRGDRSAARQGVQIDLLVQAQGLAVLVEIKRKSRIDASVEAEMRRKLEVFPRKRNVSLRTALVYEGELDESVARGGVFDFMIPIETLLA